MLCLPSSIRIQEIRRHCRSDNRFQTSIWTRFVAYPDLNHFLLPRTSNSANQPSETCCFFNLLSQVMTANAKNFSNEKIGNR